MTSLVLALVVVICLGLTAFFSGTETGYMSVSRVRLTSDPRGSGPRGTLLQRQLRSIEDPILTCLVGTNLFNVMASAAATMALTEIFGQRGQWLAVVLVSALLIVFGEIIPKVLFREYPETLTLDAVPVLGVAMTILTPVRVLLKGYSGLLERFLPISGEHQETSLDRRNLAALLLSNSVPTEGDRRFAEAVDRFLKVAGLNLGPVMRPLDSLVTVTPDTTVAACLDEAARSGFSRLPIRGEDGRGLQGYVLIRDLLFLSLEKHQQPVPRSLWHHFPLVDVRMSPYELFEELRYQGLQLALVVEPGGSLLGMISLEDLIEAVIGSVYDEFDHPGDR